MQKECSMMTSVQFAKICPAAVQKKNFIHGKFLYRAMSCKWRLLLPKIDWVQPATREQRIGEKYGTFSIRQPLLKYTSVSLNNYDTAVPENAQSSLTANSNQMYSQIDISNGKEMANSQPNKLCFWQRFDDSCRLWLMNQRHILQWLWQMRSYCWLGMPGQRRLLKTLVSRGSSKSKVPVRCLIPVVVS